MKRKVAFWVVMILANVVIGVVSIRTYQNMDARITGVENYQRNLAPYLFKDAKKLEQLESAHKKTVDDLLRALGVDGKYDFNNNLARVWDLNKFFNYKVYVRTIVDLEIPENLRESNSDSAKSLTKVSKAPAIVVGRYVLMASHVSDPEVFSRQTIRVMTPDGALGITVVFKVLKYNITLFTADEGYSLKELYRNKEKDFSLFEMYASPKLNFPFEIGKSNELRIGHFIYINGRPVIDSEVARPGYVTSLVSAIPGEALGVKKDDNQFSLSQSTNQGDSGSPIMAFRDGKPELVGIYLGWIELTDGNGKNIRSRALKINVAIDEIKEKLGLDLREIQREILNK